MVRRCSHLAASTALIRPAPLEEEHVVLDWDGKQFVRVSALEKKLAAKMDARPENKTDVLPEADIRAALGISKKK